MDTPNRLSDSLDRDAQDSPPPPAGQDVRRQVALNQIRTAEQWSETAEDMSAGRVIRTRDAIRIAHRDMFYLAILAVVVFIAGLWWSFRASDNDQILAAERAAQLRSPATLPNVPRY